MGWKNSIMLPSSCCAWTRGERAMPCGLVCKEKPLWQSEASCVLVRNEFIGLNPVDWKVLQDTPLGSVPGCDGAGEVVAIGEAVPDEWLGTRVAYHTSLGGPGSFSTFTPVPYRALLRLPEALTTQVAAGVPCPALTAWQAVRKFPSQQSRPTEMLLSGAGGGVGLYVLQLAVNMGFSVDVMCHPRHHDRLRSAGARQTFDSINIHDSSWCHVKYDVIVDASAAERAQELVKYLRANGHLVSISDRVPQWPWEPFTLAASLHEVALGALHEYGDSSDWRCITNAGEAILEDIAAGRLLSEDLRVQEFTELPMHLEAVRVREFSGKAIVRVDADAVCGEASS